MQIFRRVCFPECKLITSEFRARFYHHNDIQNYNLEFQYDGGANRVNGDGHVKDIVNGL